MAALDLDRLRELHAKIVGIKTMRQWEGWRPSHDSLLAIVTHIIAEAGFTEGASTAADELEAARAALAVPAVWTDDERDGMARAFGTASERHGHYERLFAVAAFILRHRAKHGTAPQPKPESDDDGGRVYKDDASEILRTRVLGWREWDWPEGFDRRTAELIADHVRVALAVKP